MGSEGRRSLLRIRPEGALPPLRPSAILPLLGATILACGNQPSPVITGGPGSSVTGVEVRTSELLAGGLAEKPPATNPYEGDGVALAEGERLYNWFNCAGCHGGKGGGGIGPPLADGDWIYGGHPENIFQTIVQGRPNGMPAFGSQIPDAQVWKIAAFVRTLSHPGRAEGGTTTRREGGAR